MQAARQLFRRVLAHALIQTSPEARRTCSQLVPVVERLHHPRRGNRTNLGRHRGSRGAHFRGRSCGQIRTHGQRPHPPAGSAHLLPRLAARDMVRCRPGGCIVRRELPGEPWETIQFKDHRFKSNDSHNTAVICIWDTDRIIHMAFDHHASRLNCRTSKLGAAHHPETVKWDASLFSGVLHALGSVTPDKGFTYPRFFSAPNGNLMLYDHAVTSGNGDGMIAEDNGRTWHNSAGDVIGETGKRFIHLNTPGLVVSPIPTNHGIPNKNARCAYPDGSIHIVMFHRSKRSTSPSTTITGGLAKASGKPKPRPSREADRSSSAWRTVR